MKRTLIIVLLLLTASIAWGQTIGDQINDLTKQLQDAQAASESNGAKIKKQAAKLDDIKFAAEAYKKQSARLQNDINDLNMRIQQHNNNRCTETCDQNGGNCTHNCGAYNAESASLNNEAASLQQQGQQLDQIQQTVTQQSQEWVAETKELLVENDRLTALIANIQSRLADLRGQYDQCRGSIPVTCDAPNDPILNEKCEKMHASCGRLFDGN